MGTIFFFFESDLVTEPILITSQIEVIQDFLWDIDADHFFFFSNFTNKIAEPLHVLKFEVLSSLIDHEAKTRPQRYICVFHEDFVKFAPIFEVEKLVWLPNLNAS